MMSEMFRSLKGFLYERAISPFAGAFSLMWVGFNWKPMSVYFLGQEEIKDRIAYIQCHYADLNTNLLYPLAGTILLVAVYPVMASGAFWWWEKLASWQRKARQLFDLNVPLSVPQSIELKKQLSEVNKTFAESMTTTNARVAQLEQEKQKISDELDALKPKSDPLDVARAAEQAQELSEMRERVKEMNKLLTENNEMRARIRQLSITGGGDIVAGNASVSGQGVVSGAEDYQNTSLFRKPTSSEEVQKALNDAMVHVFKVLLTAEDMAQRVTNSALEADFLTKSGGARSILLRALDILIEQNFVYQHDSWLMFTNEGRQRAIELRAGGAFG